jgi:hypothetical protein
MKRLTLCAVALLCAPLALQADEPTPPKKTADQPGQWFFEMFNPFAPDIQKVREAAARAQAQNNLKQLAEAAQAYQKANPNGQFPAYPPNWWQQNGNWAWQLLPYIEQSNVYGFGPADRLGAAVEAVNDAVRAHIDLPQGKGLLVTDLRADSAATRAGVKKFDILVKWDGKDVTADANAFAKAVADAPAKKAVSAVVLRKGKEVELKEITLPEAGPFNPIKIYQCPSDYKGPTINDGTSNTLLFGESYRGIVDGKFGWGGNDARTLTTTFRDGDRFTARYEEGSLVITLTGTVKDKKASVGGVKVIDGGKEYRFDALEKTPEEYRDKARALAGAAEKGQNPVRVP